MTKSANFSRRQFVATSSAAYFCACAPAKAQTEKIYDAVVVGAGLSGLHAAMILEELGLNVLVLEGRNRIGGRVYTLMDIPGKPEAAGELIGANYARMKDTAHRLKLDLVTPQRLGSGSKRYYNIKGQDILTKEWADHPLNPMSGEDRELLPHRYLFDLSHRNNPLSGRPLDDWLKPEFMKYDVPQDQYLRNVLGYNEETIRLMNTVIHTDHISTTSALHELRRYAVGEFNRSATLGDSGAPASLQVKGGNSLMPEAMAKSLTNDVKMNKTVISFDDDGDEVRVECGDGSSYRAKHVVCSMPYPVMRSVKFSPRLPAHRKSAINEIDYGISIQVHFLIKRKFWEDDGLPKSMWSDQPFERFGVLNRGPDGSPSSAIVFINGKEAHRYNFMNDIQAGEYTLKKLIEVRPSIEGALEPIHIQSCHRNVHGVGDWVYWKPGQVKEYGNRMREPHGRIHFCGEHTAIMERGMEGAFESGERAASDIADLL